MRFCLMVLLLYSLETIETITMAKNNLNHEAINVLKCHIYGKLKMPCLAKWNSIGPISNFIAAMSAMEVNKAKYEIIKIRLALLFQSLINSICSNRTMLF